MKSSITLTLLSALAAAIAGKTTNHPSCYQIKDTWWSTRIQLKDQGVITEWDAVCKNMNGDRSACIQRTVAARQKYIDQGLITAEQATNIGCAMLGQHSDICAGNLCNHYNTAQCTVQATGGLCNWVTQEEGKKFGLQYGCQRNPCNIGGSANQNTDGAKLCNSLSIPGFAQCTYCKGSNDPQLKGLGMGCQRVDVTTTAQCAPINQDSVSKDTIWELKTNTDCQCSSNSFLCQQEVDDKAGDFKKRYSRLRN